MVRIVGHSVQEAMTYKIMIDEYWASFCVGAMLFLLLAMWASPGGEADWIWEKWDEANPVVTGRVDMVMPDGDGVKVHISGEKFRACQFTGVHAYAVNASGSKSLIGILRVDRPIEIITRPIGKSDFGTWRIWPTLGAASAEIWVTYRCSSRVVLNRLVEVAL